MELNKNYRDPERVLNTRINGNNNVQNEEIIEEDYKDDGKVSFKDSEDDIRKIGIDIRRVINRNSAGILIVSGTVRIGTDTSYSITLGKTNVKDGSRTISDIREGEVKDKDSLLDALFFNSVKTMFVIWVRIVDRKIA